MLGKQWTAGPKRSDTEEVMGHWKYSHIVYLHATLLEQFKRERGVALISSNSSPLYALSTMKQTLKVPSCTS